MPPFFFHKPAIREFFLVLGGGFSFLQAFSMFQIEKPVLAEPEKFGNRASIFILDTGEKSVVFE
ncbi:MAG: hypothetical protein C6W57_01885 [Caldibacillus debilis]|nr:MAG: hypothetical protein BAA03_01215 [Caldibacillus debilis]REJ19092.1 MAG: hypothetical protein C6W57_01885 [Caldibacillus debilis]